MANDIPEVDLRKLADTMSFEDLLKYRSQSFLLDDDVNSDSSSDYERNDDGSIPFFAAGGKYFEEELYDQYSGYFPEPECIEKDLLLYDLYEFLFPRIGLYIDKAVEIFWIIIDAKAIILTDLYYELTSEGKTSQNSRCKSNDIQWFNSLEFRVSESVRSSEICLSGFRVSDSDDFGTCRKEDVEDQQFTNYVLTFGYYWFSNRVEHSPFRFRSFSLEKKRMSAPRKHPTPLTRDVRFIAPIMLRMFPDMRGSDRRTTFEFRETRRKLKRFLLIERLRNKIEEIGNVIPIVTPPLICLYAVSQFVNGLINKIIYPSFSLVRSLSASYLEEFPPSDPVVPPWPCRAQAVISRAY